MELKRICESLSYALRNVPSLEPYFVVPVNEKFLYIRLLSQGGMVLKVFRDFQNGELSNFQEGLIGISDNCSGGSDIQGTLSQWEGNGDIRTGLFCGSAELSVLQNATSRPVVYMRFRELDWKLAGNFVPFTIGPPSSAKSIFLQKSQNGLIAPILRKKI